MVAEIKEMNVIPIVRCCTLGMACWAVMATPFDVLAQLEYLNHGVEFAMGGFGALAKGPGDVTGGGAGIAIGNDHLSVGLEYDNSKSGSDALEFGMVHASVIEKGKNKPIGMVVSAGYSFADGASEVALVPISIVAFRRVLLDPSVAVIPEIGATKFLLIGGGADDVPPVFSGALTLAAYFQKHSAFLASPQAAYSDGKWSVGFGVAFVIGMGGRE